MRGKERELELSTVGRSELVRGERERVWFKCYGAPQNSSAQFNRSDRSPLPVRPVRPRLRSKVFV